MLAELTMSSSGSVSVPVLSKMIRSTSASRSMASPEWSSTPARNIAPDTTVCTVGMARPSAQGQVMIRTATAVT
jgi:hypothetical protein